MLGSRSATALATAWAVVRALGAEGFEALVRRTAEATGRVQAAVEEIPGSAVLGRPTGPLLALAADADAPECERVDPFMLVDAVRERGFLLQAQPACPQPDGTLVPRTAHLTMTAVSLEVVDELVAALIAGADAVRGVAPPSPDPTLVAQVAEQGLPDHLAGVMATLEALPREQSPVLLAQLLQAVIDPDRAG